MPSPPWRRVTPDGAPVAYLFIREVSGAKEDDEDSETTQLWEIPAASDKAKTAPR